VELFHCFGAKPAHAVDTTVAVAMLRVSRCRYLAVNTHNIGAVRDGADLPVGYHSATMSAVLEAMGPGAGIEPILNINHPTSAGEAVARSLRAVEMTGIRKLKLEVLDAALRVADNAQVLTAAEELSGHGLEVWPLLWPVWPDLMRAIAMPYPVVRVMGAPIGSRAGLGSDLRAAVSRLAAEDGHDATLMLDGGVGSAGHVIQAARLGFDAVLVNSVLFEDEHGPVATLAGLRQAVDAAAVGPDPQAPAARATARG
jgi:thiazole synthase